MAPQKNFRRDDTDDLLSIPLHLIAEQNGWQMKGRMTYSKGRRNNTYHHDVYGSIDITDRGKSRDGYDEFIDRSAGTGGGLYKFMTTYGIAQPGKDVFDKLRAYLGKNDYKVKQAKQAEPVKEQEKAPIKALEFEPAKPEELNYLLNRGIKAETLSKELFFNRFGLSEKEFGEAEQGKARYSKDQFEEPKFLVVPYYDNDGNIINKEYIGRLKEEEYSKEYDRVLRSGDSVSKVRRNPSSFIAGADKNCGWISQVPRDVKPSTLIIGEQSTDLMSFYQLNIDNRPELDQAIFYGIGGNLSKGQIDSIKALVEKYGITQVEFAVDNDLAGLRYAATLRQELVQDPIMDLQLDSQSKRSIGLTVMNYAQLSNDQFLAKQEEVSKKLREVFPDASQVLYTTAGIDMVRINVPYTPENAKKIFNLYDDLIPSNGIKTIYHNPDKSKDWNDYLRGIENAEIINAVHLVALEDVKMKLHVDAGGAILLHHENLNSERGIVEPIGSISLGPNVDERVQLLPRYIGNAESNALIDSFKKDVNALLPALNDATLNELFNGTILYSPLAKNFTRRGADEVVAQIGEGQELIINNVSSKRLSELELTLIEAKTKQVLSGSATHMKTWHLKGNELYDNSYNNYRLRYVDAKTSPSGEMIKPAHVLRSFDIATWDHEKNVPDYKFLNDSIKDHLRNNKNDIVKLYDAYRAMQSNTNPESQEFADVRKQYWELSQKTNIRIETSKGQNGQIDAVRYLKPVAEWDSIENKWNYKEADFDKKQIEVLERFAKYKIEGRDVYKPGLIGKIDENYNLQLAKGLSREKSLNPIENLYLVAFEQHLESVFQKNIQQLKELYPEPRANVHASKNTLYSEVTPVLIYDNEKQGFMMNPDVYGRSFSNQFWKQAELFVKNEGTYLGYDKNVMVNLETNEIFYKQPDMTIGVVIRDESGTAFYALYSNVPDVMKEEIRMVSPIKEASDELIESKGININAGITKIKNKESKTKNIPNEFKHHFQGGKFIIQSKDVLKTKNARYKEVYMQAYLWDRQYNQEIVGEDKLEKRANQGVHWKDNDLYYNRMRFGHYDAVSDRIVLTFTPQPIFFQEIAILERQKVKDITHRQFGAYLQQPSEEKAIKGSRAKIESLLELIDIDLEKGLLKFRTDDFKVRNFAKIDGENIFIETSFLEAFPEFKTCMDIIAKSQNLQIQEIESIKERDTTYGVKTENEVIKDITFSHTLLLTEEGIIKTFSKSEEFKGVFEVDDSNIGYVNFVYTESGNTRVPLNESGKETGMWISNFPSEKMEIKSQFSQLRPVLVFCETPEYGLLHLQSDLLRNINTANYYMSLPGHDLDKTNEIIQSLMKDKEIDTILFIGSKPFSDKYYDLYSDPKIGGEYKVLNPPMDLKEVDTLVSIKKEISNVSPDGNIQKAVNEINVGNMYNVAEGIVIVPLISPAGRDKAIVGQTVKLGKLKGADGKTSESVYVSSVTNPQRATLSPDFRETIFYMAINKDFIQDEKIITFSDKVNPNSIRFVRDMISKARYDAEEGKVAVLNPSKYRFYAEISSHKFLNGAHTPAPTGSFKTFEEEYLTVYNPSPSLDLSGHIFNYEMGNSNAPGETIHQERKIQYEVIRSVDDNIANSSIENKK